jgi:hypothetical protein
VAASASTQAAMSPLAMVVAVEEEEERRRGSEDGGRSSKLRFPTTHAARGRALNGDASGAECRLIQLLDWRRAFVVVRAQVAPAAARVPAGVGAGAWVLAPQLQHAARLGGC